MKNDIGTLPPSPLQASVEASFTIRGWNYEVREGDGTWTTTTTVNGPAGPTLLEIVVVPEPGRIVARVDLGLRCPPEHRWETALLLAWLDLWLDLATFGMGPTTGQLYLRCGLSEELGGRISAEAVDQLIGHIAERHIRFVPLLSRVVRGQVDAVEGLRLLRLGV